MRVILDFQACQSGSRFRGIGRGSRSLMLEMGRTLKKEGHEVICLISEAFQDGLNRLKADLHAELPEAEIYSFRIPSPCAAAWPENGWRQMAARMLREHAIACLEPDFVHIPALLADGWGDDAVASIGLLGIHIPVSLTQHDLIPLVMADTYMPPGLFRDYYEAKLKYVTHADLLLAISEYSREEAIQHLGLPPERVVHISSAADSQFWNSEVNDSEINATLAQYGIQPGFLLYAPGGFDYRKNLDRLIEAYSLLPIDVRTHHQLVIASQLDPGRRELLEQTITKYGLNTAEVTLTDYVSDLALKQLYCACFAYIFPSLHEGFGLPALEAMSCGAPVIASNCTSIPEVLNMEEALFDPKNPKDISAKMLQLIQVPEFRARLIKHAKYQANQFSWEESAKVAVNAIEARHKHLLNKGWKPAPKTSLPSCEELLGILNSMAVSPPPSDNDIQLFRDCFHANYKAAQ